MKIHRFIDNFDLSKKELEIQGEIAHQIAKVLKLKIGEKIELGDGKGSVALSEIKKLEKDYVIVALLRQGYAGQNSTKKVNLFCAILKKENFELVVQKTTETGVSKIIPIITARTIKTGLNLERLKKIAKEASEQSGRATVPEILEPISFTESLKLINKNETNILFDSSGELLLSEPNFKLTKSYKLKAKSLFIGPEGGWTIEEIKKAQESGFEIKTLGKNTLRAETAAIVSTYLIKNL